MASTINGTQTGNGGLITTGDDSGILQLQTNETTAVTIDASQKVSFTNPIQGGSITSGTAVASTSGTSLDFTSIPSWVKRITVMFSGVSTNGGSQIQVQLGSGSVTTSGYLSGGGRVVGTGAAGASLTSGFLVAIIATSTDTQNGSFVFTNLSGNIWTCQGSVFSSGYGATQTGAGQVSLSGALDRVRITTVTGTDTFDSGSINILCEG